MHRGRLSIGSVVAVVGFAISIASGRLVAQAVFTRVNVDSSGNQSSGRVQSVAMSGDGRSVAFVTPADDLVANDTNGHSDVFVHDCVTGATVRVSVDSSGGEGDGDSGAPSLSYDGRFVAFESLADNFVANDVNGQTDVFLHDRDPDGNGVFDEGNGATTMVSVARNGAPPKHFWSTHPSISGDGRLVAFSSAAFNLIVGDLNGLTDVFVRDLSTATTTIASVDSNGNQTFDGGSYDPSISEDGSAVAFSSAATSLVPNDKNGTRDIFVRDLVLGTTTRISVDSAGNEADNSNSLGLLSSDGRFAGFSSYASNLVGGDTNKVYDVFVHDRTTGVTERYSVDSWGAEGDDDSFLSAISGDGDTLAFTSEATNLAPGGGYSVYIHERTTGRTYVASGRCGEAPNGGSQGYSISRSGDLVAFVSNDDDLVDQDDNQAYDAFVFDRTIDASSFSTYGTGFPGSNGIPSLATGGFPALGTTLPLEISNSSGSWTIGFLLVGTAQASTPTGRGGVILVDAPVIVPFVVPPPGITLSEGVPFDPAYAGLFFDLQVVEADAGAQYGLSFTPGLELKTGR